MNVESAETSALARKRGVIYARYSSHRQTEQSIEGQLRVCYEFAARENIDIVGEYIDRALTGRSDDRPEFQRMIADSCQLEFYYVVVYKIDRFARSRYDSAIYKHKLKLNNVKLLSATENISDSPEGVILEALLEASAEYYSLELSQKIKRGRYESAKKGKYIGGTVPIGFKIVDGKYVEDERTSLTVKWAFEQYAAGMPKREILDVLNARGIRGRTGKPLGHNALSTTLRNKKYIGILEQSGVKIEGSCPALIDIETFEKVQARIAQNRRAGARNAAAVKYLLSGKLYCGMCSTSMVGGYGRGRHGGNYYYYTCGTRKRGGGCKKTIEKKRDFRKLCGRSDVRVHPRA